LLCLLHVPSEYPAGRRSMRVGVPRVPTVTVGGDTL
jgi:hypothetical protein